MLTALKVFKTHRGRSLMMRFKEFRFDGSRGKRQIELYSDRKNNFYVSNQQIDVVRKYGEIRQYYVDVSLGPTSIVFIIMRVARTRSVQYT